MMVQIRYPEKLVYPESDGKPLGENTVQFKWIITLFLGIESLFRHRDDVFVASDLFWYPVYGDTTYAMAPDVMVAFGRPKGDRGSYKQWEENNVAPQVIFEVLSPSNTKEDAERRLDFYRLQGVEEYYEYNPETHELRIWLRRGSRLATLKKGKINGFVSPRLRVRFDVPLTESMRLVGPDGRPFLNHIKLLDEAASQQQMLFEARQQAVKEAQRADAEHQRAEKLAARIRELGVDPDRI